MNKTHRYLNSRIISFVSEQNEMIMIRSFSKYCANIKYNFMWLTSLEVRSKLVLREKQLISQSRK